MNITGSLAQGLMACGDDTGSIWLYSLPDWLRKEAQKSLHLPARILPIGRLPWPHVEGMCRNEEADILIDKVAISPCGSRIVAVTGSNIVAFWERCLVPGSE